MGRRLAHADDGEAGGVQRHRPEVCEDGGWRVRGTRPVLEIPGVRRGAGSDNMLLRQPLDCARRLRWARGGPRGDAVLHHPGRCRVANGVEGRILDAGGPHRLGSRYNIVFFSPDRAIVAEPTYLRVEEMRPDVEESRPYDDLYKQRPYNPDAEGPFG